MIMIKRALLATVFALALCVPAHAVALLNVPVTTAIGTSVTSNYQLRGGGGRVLPTNVGVQCTFTYGSGGTTASAWVQTSFDGGTTWVDVAQCGFATASGRFLYNLSSLTPVTTQYVPTDGTLGANTSKDGLMGNFWRVKYSSTGTYAGGTVLRVDLITNGLTAQ